jgi:hypothetical protein
MNAKAPSRDSAGPSFCHGVLAFISLRIEKGAQPKEIEMDKQTLLAAMDFARGRLLASIEAIEKSGQDPAKVLAWRPAPGRAHIGWQLMHCAATHHRHLYATLQGKPIADEKLVTDFAGGSKPSDQNVPTLEGIKSRLASTFTEFKAYLAGVSASELSTRKVGPPDRQRPLEEWLMLYTWHEAHHQGQVHLTWNLYKAAHGIAG